MKSATRNSALRTAAHKFAQYALILHCPWDNATSPPVRNWEQFVNFTGDLRTEGTARARSILHWVGLLADGLAPDDAEKAAVMQYRARNSDKWEDLGDPEKNPEVLFHRPMREKPSAGGEGGLSEARRRAAEEAIEGHVGRAREITNSGASILRLDAEFCSSACANVNGVFVGEVCVPVVDPFAPPGAGHDVATAGAMFDKLIQSEPPDSLPTPRARAPAPGQPFGSGLMDENLDDHEPAPTRLSDACNEEQKLVHDDCERIMIEYARWREAGSIPSAQPKQRLKIIHGGPGAGKSFIINALDETAAALGVTHSKMAFMASAANLIGGRTIHGAGGFLWGNTTKALEHTRKLNQTATIWAIIIDEISAVEWSLFLKLDRRYRTIMGRQDLPFGGLTVILFGDFFQLPPPVGRGSSSLYDALVKTQVHLDLENTEMNACSDVFKLFQKTELHGNVRAKNDADWAGLISRIRDPTPGANAIEEHLMKRLDGMVITARDVAEDPKWSDAPICVCGNRHRMGLVEARARSIALRLGVPVVRWRVAIAGVHAQLLSDEQADILFQSDPRLVGYFIQGFGGYLNENVKPDRRVSNGSPFIFHSLTLGKKEGADCDDADRAGIENDEARIRAALPGDVVELSAPPFSVNIKLILHSGVEPGEYDDVSLVPGQAVLPVLCKHKKSYKCYVPGLGVVIIDTKTHGADVAVAGTFNKAQGRTMERVLACLNIHPSPPHLSFEAIFVFLSRVKYGKHCKILPLHPGENWDHLKKLRPSANLVAYLGGFNDADGTWSRERAKMKLDESLALNTARDLVLDREKKTKANQKRKKAKGTTGGPAAPPRPVPLRKVVCGSTASLSNITSGSTSFPPGSQPLATAQRLRALSTDPLQRGASTARGGATGVAMEESGGDDLVGTHGDAIFIRDDDDDDDMPRECDVAHDDGDPGIEFNGPVGLTPAELTMALFAQNQDPQSLVAGIGDVATRARILGKHFARLRPGLHGNGSYLQDEIINGVAHLLTRRDIRRCRVDEALIPSAIFSSFFMPQLPKRLNELESNRWVQRWAHRSMDRVGGNPFNLGWLFVPVNRVNSHWMLLAADMRNKRVYFYDSASNFELGTAYMNQFLIFLELRAPFHPGVHFETSEWVLFPASATNPKQANWYDCGVFVLMGIYFISSDLPWDSRVISDADLQNFRLCLTHWLLKGRLD